MINQSLENSKKDPNAYLKTVMTRCLESSNAPFDTIGAINMETDNKGVLGTLFRQAIDEASNISRNITIRKFMLLNKICESSSQPFPNELIIEIINKLCQILYRDFCNNKKELCSKINEAQRRAGNVIRGQQLVKKYGSATYINNSK